MAGHTCWPPDERIGPDYQGPYPRRDLENARRALIDCLVQNCEVNSIMAKLKPKLGIVPPNGRLDQPTNAFGVNVNQNPVLPVWGSGDNVQWSQYPERPQHHKDISPNKGLGDGENRPILKPFRHTQDPGWKPRPTSSATLASQARAQSWDSPNGQNVNSSINPQRWNSPMASRNMVMQDSSSPGNDQNRASPSSQGSGQRSGGSIPPLLATPPSAELLTSKRKLTEIDESEPSNKRKMSSFHYQSETMSNFMTNKPEQMYKCDFCKFYCHSLLGLEDHLAATKHYSGSLYNVQRGAQGEFEVVSVEDMLVSSNKFNMNSTLVVICPDCHEVFQDIFMCGIHHKYNHGSVQGKYSICPVFSNDTISFSSKPYCMTCNTDFNSHSKLGAHWKKNMDHILTKPSTKPNIESILIFSCPYCARFFHSCFFSCKAHILQHHRSMNKDVYAVGMKQVVAPRVKLELPLFNTSDGRENGSAKEFHILRNTITFYSKHRESAKQTKRDIRRQMSSLQYQVEGTPYNLKKPTFNDNTQFRLREYSLFVESCIHNG